MQRNKPIQQVSFLSENYNPLFINSDEVYNHSKKRFKFSDSGSVKRDTKIYQFQSTYDEKNENRKHHYKYYVLEQSNQKINNKPLYLPRQVFPAHSIYTANDQNRTLIDNFDTSNDKVEIIRNQIRDTKKTTFVYPNGPLQNDPVSHNIDIFHINQKGNYCVHFIFIYKEMKDKIEAHPFPAQTPFNMHRLDKTYELYHNHKYQEKVKEKLIDNKNNRNKIFAAQTLSNLSIFAEQELGEMEHDEEINYPLTPGRDTEEENKIEEISSAPKFNNLKTIKFIMPPIQEEISEDNNGEIDYPPILGSEIEEENKEIIKIPETKKRKITFLFIDPEKEPQNKKQNINIDEDKKQNLIDRLKKKQEDKKNKEAREKFKQQEREQFNENNESTKIIPGAKIEIQKRIVTIGRTSKK